MTLDPSAPDAWPRLEFAILVERLVGVIFNKLKALSMLALISRLAPSPRTGILGNPKALAMLRSTSRYPGPGNELRVIPGGGMKFVVDCPGLSVIALA